MTSLSLRARQAASLSTVELVELAAEAQKSPRTIETLAASIRIAGEALQRVLRCDAGPLCRRCHELLLLDEEKLGLCDRCSEETTHDA